MTSEVIGGRLCKFFFHNLGNVVQTIKWENYVIKMKQNYRITQCGQILVQMSTTPQCSSQTLGVAKTNSSSNQSVVNSSIWPRRMDLKSFWKWEKLRNCINPMNSASFSNQMGLWEPRFESHPPTVGVGVENRNFILTFWSVQVSFYSWP